MSECPSHAAERYEASLEAEHNHLMDILMDAFHAHRAGTEGVCIEILEADWDTSQAGFGRDGMNIFTISFEATPMQVAEWEHEELMYKEMMEDDL